MSYFYHYTTLPVLISVIKNRKLRLTRLDKFIDLYEGINLSNVSEFLQIATNLYVSSWTKCDRESISAWKLYCNLHNGVRIGINSKHLKNDKMELECQISPVPMKLIGFEFRHKEALNELKIHEIFQCDDYKQEIYDFINFDLGRTTPQTYSTYLWRKKRLPFLTSNGLISSQEIRLTAQTKDIERPTTKAETDAYDRDTIIDDNFIYVQAPLKQNFFDECEILVSPDFPEAELITLNAFLSSVHLDNAKRSELTSLYRCHESLNDFLTLSYD